MSCCGDCEYIEVIEFCRRMRYATGGRRRRIWSHGPEPGNPNATTDFWEVLQEAQADGGGLHGGTPTYIGQYPEPIVEDAVEDAGKCDLLAWVAIRENDEVDEDEVVPGIGQIVGFHVGRDSGRNLGPIFSFSYESPYGILENTDPLLTFANKSFQKRVVFFGPPSVPLTDGDPDGDPGYLILALDFNTENSGYGIFRPHSGTSVPDMDGEDSLRWIPRWAYAFSHDSILCCVWVQPFGVLTEPVGHYLCHLELNGDYWEVQSVSDVEVGPYQSAVNPDTNSNYVLVPGDNGGDDTGVFAVSPDLMEGDLLYPDMAGHLSRWCNKRYGLCEFLLECTSTRRIGNNQETFFSPDFWDEISTDPTDDNWGDTLTVGHHSAYVVQDMTPEGDKDSIEKVEPEGQPPRLVDHCQDSCGEQDDCYEGMPCDAGISIFTDGKSEQETFGLPGCGDVTYHSVAIRLESNTCVNCRFNIRYTGGVMLHENCGGSTFTTYEAGDYPGFGADPCVSNFIIVDWLPGTLAAVHITAGCDGACGNCFDEYTLFLDDLPFAP